MTAKYGKKQPSSSNQKVKDLTSKITSCLKMSAEKAIEAGNYLSQLKKIVPRNQFLQILQTDVGISEKHAMRFIKLFETFGSVSTKFIKDAKPSVLYELAYTLPKDENLNLANGGKISINGKAKSIVEINTVDLKKVRKKTKRFDFERDLATLLDEIQTEIEYFRNKASRANNIKDRTLLKSFIRETAQCVQSLNTII